MLNACMHQTTANDSLDWRPRFGMVGNGLSAASHFGQERGTKFRTLVLIVLGAVIQLEFRQCAIDDPATHLRRVLAS